MAGNAAKNGKSRATPDGVVSVPTPSLAALVAEYERRAAIAEREGARAPVKPAMEPGPLWRSRPARATAPTRGRRVPRGPAVPRDPTQEAAHDHRSGPSVRPHLPARRDLLDPLPRRRQGVQGVQRLD